MDIENRLYLKQIVERIPTFDKILNLAPRSDKSYKLISYMINETMIQHKEIISLDYSEDLWNVLTSLLKKKIISEFWRNNDKIFTKW